MNGMKSCSKCKGGKCVGGKGCAMEAKAKSPMPVRGSRTAKNKAKK
jgi:hypothetical protein